MRARTLALLVVALLGTGCGGDSKSVAGTWRLDSQQAADFASRSLALRTGDDASGAEAAAVLSQISMEFDLAADGTFRARASMQGRSHEAMAGRWEDRGDVVVLTATTVAGRAVPRPSSTELRKRDGKLVADADGLPMTLARK